MRGMKDMPDITMCKYHQCPKSSTCYRYMAKPDSLYQSYFLIDENFLKHKDNCDYYWEIRDAKQVQTDD